MQAAYAGNGMGNVGQALVAELARRGVEVVFGIPGVHTVELYRGLPGSGIRHVTPRHEQGAGFMADGYARATGKPGVAFVITGPGLTNVLTPMGQARADSVPMLVVSSVGRSATLGKGLGYLHELPDQHALVAQVALLSIHVARPAELYAAIDRAFRRMTEARPGPVHIEVPMDVMKAEMPEEVWAGEVDSPAVAWPDPGLFAAVVDRLAAAKAPVILAGGGAKAAEMPLRALAERLGAPVVLTVNARGLMHGHELVVPASPSLPAVRALIAGADLVLALGTEIGPTDYDMYATGTMPEMAGLIRVDICAEQLRRRPAEVTICLDAGRAAEALLAGLPDELEPLPEGPSRAAAARVAAREDIGPVMQAQLAVVEVMRDACPGALIVGDSTQPIYAGNLYYDHDAPGRWFNAAMGFGALGYGIPAAIGAAVGAPDVPVICIAGDGGAQFSLPEMMAAVDEKLPITFVIWNNRGYREIAENMREAGIEVIGCDPTPPDFAFIAAACGVGFTRVPMVPEAVRAAFVQEWPRKGPRMIEITVI